MKSFISWSGGKDACLSYYKAVKNEDVEALCFLNMVSEDGKKSRTHGISSALLRAQAEAIDLPIFQNKTTWNNYETEFKKTVLSLKQKDVVSGVFGDIDLDEHRQWVERVCRETGVSPIFPLWQREREELLSEFIGAGFEAIVVAVKKDVLGPEWLGRKIDKSFMRDLKKMESVDLCGEAGEYHTFVYNGPLFNKRIKIKSTDKQKGEKSNFLKILDYEIIDKN
ncbi:MAG: diphthine--ammonia ligase [Candidatus Omnitrophota bacterium]|nr:diphthine--ammonia ligase [Candidatus Omnitrophota bacterium]MBU1894822.1 diphthine--ammonia ligase [Candidatus Omnitrophota bacterium]